MTTCRRCNRVLKREPYRSQGIGKICASKEAAENASKKQNESDNDTIVPYDGGDIFIERLKAPTITRAIGHNTQLDMLTHPASGIRTNVQRTVYKHSPTGFNFGYGGSGPSDFALNTLLMFCVDKQNAHEHYQEFKFKFVGASQEDKLVIPIATIKEFLTEKGVKNNIPEPPKVYEGDEAWKNGFTIN